ncbi:MAG: RagB/SusD family nutrient uptake outer membrane protein, partial [Bacteroidota bacterium]
MSGQQGPAGDPDIQGIDEGFSSYLRQYWKAQELPTDEAVIGWNDGSLPDYSTGTWGTGNEFVSAMYSRIFYQVVLCNEFIRETTDEKLNERGLSADQIATTQTFRAEARFLRALSYWHAIDLFGSVPFVTEDDPVGSFFPEQISRADLFAYVESELQSMMEDLAAARENEYGRADQAAAKMLLAKLYMNAEVYVGQSRYAEALALCQEILDAGYSLNDDYESLYLTDNNTSDEIIFPITFDGVRTRTWGGMTFLVHAPVGGTMDPDAFGINGGWGGIRSTSAMVKIFDPSFDLDNDSLLNTTDERAMFYTDNQRPFVADLFTYEDGYGMTKFKNVDYVNGDTIPGSDIAGDHIDSDFPMFRLADVYLMYAEAVVRGGGGSESQALDLVNQLRNRAGTNEVSSLDLDFLLD